MQDGVGAERHEMPERVMGTESGSVSNDAIANLPMRQDQNAGNSPVSNTAAVVGPISTDGYTRPVASPPPIESPVEDEPIIEEENDDETEASPAETVIVNDNRVMSANFPGLVDVVLDASGNIGFLVKNNRGFYFTQEETSPDGVKVFIPPPRDQFL